MKKAGSGKRAKFVLAACCLIILTASLGVTQSEGLVPTKVLSSEGGAAYSKDSKLMATSAGVKIKIYQTNTGRVLRTLEGHTAAVSAIAFSPTDNKILASGSVDKTARIWDISTGNSLKTINLPSTGFINSGVVRTLAFSLDGSKIAVGSDETNIYEVSTGNQSLIMETGSKSKSNRVSSLAFSPDGNFLVTGNSDKTAKIFSVANGKQVAVLKGHQSEIYTVSYSPNGKLIVVGGGMGEDTVAMMNKMQSQGLKMSYTNDSSISLWDASTFQQVKKLEGHKFLVSRLCFTSDGKKLISGSYDKTIKIWDIVSGAEIRSISLDMWVAGMTLKPDGTELAVSLINSQYAIDDSRIYDMMAVLGK